MWFTGVKRRFFNGTEGTINSYTVPRVPVGKIPVSCAIGMMTLPEAVRLTVPLVGGGLRIGAPMEMVMAALRAGDDGTHVDCNFPEIT